MSPGIRVMVSHFWYTVLLPVMRQAPANYLSGKPYNTSFLPYSKAIFPAKNPEFGARRDLFFYGL